MVQCSLDQIVWFAHTVIIYSSIVDRQCIALFAWTGRSKKGERSTAGQNHFAADERNKSRPQTSGGGVLECTNCIPRFRGSAHWDSSSVFCLRHLIIGQRLL